MPLGLLSLASYLRAHKVEVHLLDCHTGDYTQGQLIESIKTLRPTLIGLNISTPNRMAVYEIVERIKRDVSDSVVVVGGPHATCLPEDVFNHAPHIDGVVMGEGEKVVLNILNALPHLRSFPGFFARQDVNRHVATHFPPRIKHIDSLPMPAYDLIDLRKYLSVSPELYVSCSRGCKYNCVFCCSQILLGRHVEFRTYNSVINEMTTLKNLYKIEQFYFYDDNLLIWPDVKAFCEKMTNHKIRWSAQAAINDFEINMLPLLLSGGCRRLSFGLESGSPSMQKYIGKVIKPDAADKITALNQSGILTRAFIIVGFPNESIHDIAETALYLIQLRAAGLSDVAIFPARPFPGTRLFRDCVALLGNDRSEELLEFQYLEDYDNEADQKIKDKLQRYNTIPLVPINKEFNSSKVRTLIKTLYKLFFYHAQYMKMTLTDLTAHLINEIAEGQPLKMAKAARFQPDVPAGNPLN
jgi:radical SAM superfamily enzyme YgiQ (UPF0313 family)